MNIIRYTNRGKQIEYAKQLKINFAASDKNLPKGVLYVKVCTYVLKVCVYVCMYIMTLCIKDTCIYALKVYVHYVLKTDVHMY